MDEQKRKEQDKVIDILNKHFGANTVMRMKSGPLSSIEVVSTGSIRLNEALGIDGWPKGRIIEIYGAESSGKTTLTLHAMAEYQKLGKSVAFVDAEHALDPQYAEKLGVNMQDLILSQPENGEQALNIVDMLAKSETVDLIVVDSVAALVPKAELEGEVGDHHVGVQARMMGQAMRKLAGTAHKSGTTIIFINQTRMKIGVMFGSPITTTGGNALKFYASIRCEVARIGTLKIGSADDAEAVGNKTRVKVVKNKLAPPFKECEFDIVFGKGIDKMGELLDIATEKDLVKKSGAWYSYNEVKIGQGRNNSIQFLQENPEIVVELQNKIKEK